VDAYNSSKFVAGLNVNVDLSKFEVDIWSVGGDPKSVKNDPSRGTSKNPHENFENKSKSDWKPKLGTFWQTHEM
jgi:hypothetical protein